MSPWSVLGWLLVGIVGFAVAIRALIVLLKIAAEVADAWPNIVKRWRVRLHLARCEWFEWSATEPSWPNEVRFRRDDRSRYHCRAKAAYRLEHGTLRCAEHKTKRHGPSRVSYARPLYEAS